jgi:hypothetical protein
LIRDIMVVVTEISSQKLRDTLLRRLDQDEQALDNLQLMVGEGDWESVRRQVVKVASSAWVAAKQIEETQSVEGINLARDLPMIRIQNETEAKESLGSLKFGLERYRDALDQGAWFGAVLYLQGIIEQGLRFKDFAADEIAADFSSDNQAIGL